MQKCSKVEDTMACIGEAVHNLKSTATHMVFKIICTCICGPSNKRLKSASTPFCTFRISVCPVHMSSSSAAPLEQRSRFYRELAEKDERVHKARAAWSTKKQLDAHYLPGEEVFSSIREADKKLSIKEAKRTHQGCISMTTTGVMSIRYLKHTSMDVNWYHEHEY